MAESGGKYLGMWSGDLAVVARYAMWRRQERPRGSEMRLSTVSGQSQTVGQTTAVVC